MNLALLITILQTACDQEKTIEIQYPTSIPELNDGIVSQFKRFSKAITALKNRDAGIVLTPAMGATEATSIALTYSPERFNELIETFKRNYSQIPEMLKEQKLNEANSQWFMNNRLEEIIISPISRQDVFLSTIYTNYMFHQTALYALPIIHIIMYTLKPIHHRETQNFR